jgi:hypothetical protein
MSSRHSIHATYRRLADSRAFALAWSVFLILLSLVLFVVMLSLVRAGAVAMAPEVDTRYADTGSWGGLGMGWLISMLTLNGSAMAATAVVMLNTGTVGAATAYGMIHGSRMGAGFFVLLVGVIYELRETNDRKALWTGLQTLIVAQSIHAPAFLLGLLVMALWGEPNLALFTEGDTQSLVDAIVDPPLALIKDAFPYWLWLPMGFVGLLYSFSLFDRAVKQLINLRGAMNLPHIPDRFFQPLPLFLAGLLITSFTMSVAISLSLLVPLVARGVVQQRYTLPYIMGAGISTFIDTFFAASLLHDSTAQGVVMLVLGWVTAVSLLILLIDYRAYEQFIEAATEKLLSRRRYLGLYVGLTFASSILLMVIPWAVR